MKNQTQSIWITPELLSWHWLPESASLYSEEAWRRPYALWQHAEELLTTDASEFARTDIVTTLKRAVDHRIRALMNLYDLRDLPLQSKPDGKLDLLAYVGLVRPLMVQRLVEIRNSVEHADEPPPSVETCEVFTEFAWYFLKSTDHVTRSVIDRIEVEMPGVERDHEFLPYPYRLELVVSPDDGWIPRISSRLKGGWASRDPQTSWLHVMATRVESGTQFIERAKQSNDMDPRLIEVAVDPDDVFVNGEIRGPSSALLTIYRKYFDL